MEEIAKEEQENVLMTCSVRHAVEEETGMKYQYLFKDGSHDRDSER